MKDPLPTNLCHCLFLIRNYLKIFVAKFKITSFCSGLNSASDGITINRSEITADFRKHVFRQKIQNKIQLGVSSKSFAPE